jgi:ATP-dependent protease ClpP protease subunit
MARTVRTFDSFEDADFYSTKKAHQLYLYDDVDEATASALRDGIENAHQATDKKPIVIHVDSQGGLIDRGFQMLAAIRESRLPVAVVIEGLSASAATFTTIFAPYRVMGTYSLCLIHQYRIEGFVSNTREELQHRIRKLNLKDKYMREHVYEKRTKLTRGEIDELMTRDVLLDAKWCLDKGVVNRLIERHPIVDAASSNAAINRSWSRFPKFKLTCKEQDGTSAAYKRLDERLTEQMEATDSPLAKPGKPLLRGMVFMATESNCLEKSLSEVWRLVHRFVAVRPRVTVVSVVTSSISLRMLLATLTCAHRVMHAHVFVDMSYPPILRGASTVQDVVHNATTDLKRAQTLLKQYTRLPAHMIEALGSSRYTLSARMCRKYGLCDAVIGR